MNHEELRKLGKEIGIEDYGHYFGIVRESRLNKRTKKGNPMTPEQASRFNKHSETVTRLYL